MELRSKIDPGNLPKHIAIIMDGNGRWAKEQGKFRVFGHRHGVESVRRLLEAAIEIGIPFLTLYAFSVENWNRPRLEVIALMEIFVSSINKETKTLMKNGVKLKAIGDLTQLPEMCRKQLQKAIDETAGNTVCTLILALSYGARHEIVEATKQIAMKAKSGEVNISDIDERLFAEHLYTKEIPDPELMIRTSGELRISNFLLWQLAYAELYFTDTLWPAFKKEDLYKAILEYQRRERRFGQTSEQVMKR